MADVIRQVRPTHILTHWRASIHKDHAAAFDIEPLGKKRVLSSLP